MGDAFQQQFCKRIKPIDPWASGPRPGRTRAYTHYRRVIRNSRGFAERPRLQNLQKASSTFYGCFGRWNSRLLAVGGGLPKILGMDQAGAPDYLIRILDMITEHGRAAVKLPSVSIAKLMLVVAIVAANLAIGRVLAAGCPVLPVAIALTGFALQAGAFALIRSRGRRRVFLAGLMAFGSMAMMSVIWAMVFAPNVGIAHDPSTGKMITLKIPGSLMWTIWSGYVEFVETSVAEPLRISLDPMGIAAVVIWSLPQFLIALTGGLLTVLIAGRWGNARASTGSDKSTQSPPASLLSARI
jgi:hypothetical protein